MNIQPYLIIPNLIIQPTWGGDYIRKFKGLEAQALIGQKIGQSYELYESTNFSPQKSFNLNHTFEIGNPEDPEKTLVYGETDPLNIKQLIKTDPQAVLGAKALSVHGEKMGVLIKFTQAKGNSYQLHVKKDTKDWQTKPESWFYFEDGYITLGVKPNIDWSAYEQACRACEATAQKLSLQVKNHTMSLLDAQHQIALKIKKLNIEQFVNFVHVHKNEAIDLSACGIHHSWEEDEKKYPWGNVVYEVQKNVFDPISTIRSFDKGKIKPDGSVRPIQIDDYFTYIDRSQMGNDPATYKKPQKLIKQTGTCEIVQIFENKYYHMHTMKFKEILNDENTQTKDSFHHLFIKEGVVSLEAKATTLEISQGQSVFIPNIVGHYVLRSKTSATILKTFV